MLSYHITTDSASDCENKEASCWDIDALERFDSYTGTVVGYAPRGVRILMENGIECFSFGNARIGDMVLVSIQRVDLERNRVRCSIDSFLNYAA